MHLFTFSKHFPIAGNNRDRLPSWLLLTRYVKNFSLNEGPPWSCLLDKAVSIGFFGRSSTCPWTPQEPPTTRSLGHPSLLHSRKSQSKVSTQPEFFQEHGMTPKDFTVPTGMLRTEGAMDAAVSQQPPGLPCHREPQHRDSCFLGWASSGYRRGLSLGSKSSSLPCFLPPGPAWSCLSELRKAWQESQARLCCLPLHPFLSSGFVHRFLMDITL